MWVHPAFKKKLQKEAVDMEMSLLKLTEKLAENDDSISFAKVKQKRRGNKFGIF